MPEPPKSAAGKARATVARSFNRVANRDSLRAANQGRRTARNPTAGNQGLSRQLNARASASNRAAGNLVRRTSPNLRAPRPTGNLARANQRRRRR